MFAGCLIIGKFLSANIISLLIQVGVGILIYGISLIILKDKFVYDVLDKIKVKLKIE